MFISFAFGLRWNRKFGQWKHTSEEAACVIGVRNQGEKEGFGTRLPLKDTLSVTHFLQVQTTSNSFHHLPISSRNFESMSRWTHLWIQSAQNPIIFPKPRFWTLFTSGTKPLIYEPLANTWHQNYRTLFIDSWIISKIKFLYLPKKKIKVD